MFTTFPNDNTQAIVTKVYQSFKAQSLATAFSETLLLDYPIRVTTIGLLFSLKDGTPSVLAKNINIVLTGGLGKKDFPIYVEAGHSENNLVLYNNIDIPIGMGVKVQCSAVSNLYVDCLIIFEKLKVQQD